MNHLQLNRALRVVGAFLLLGLITMPLHSQLTTTQTIEGLVTDVTGAVIPGATVTMTNVDTGVTTNVDTNETGNYRFSYVAVGNYEVSCELDGFKTQSATGVRVETTAQVRSDFVMEVGDITETIEVAADAITLNTENATVGQVIENKRIIDLPLNGRNIVQLAVMVPGVQFGQRSGMVDGMGGTTPGGSFSVSANGVRELHQVVSIDGVDARSPRRSITPFVPSIEAIEEFKIQTSSYSGEVGFGGGAVVNITMKSGTNEIHGTVFEFLRNDKLDAEAYFLNFERSAGEERSRKDPRRRNQFGGVVSGPLVKNKTFWALNWEARREVLTRIREGFFPHDDMRSGDYSELLTGTINPENGNLFRQPIVIYDPFTGDPFPNNIIPVDRHQSGIVNNIYPDFVPRAQFRQADPLDFTIRRGVRDPINVDNFFGRVDHNISDVDRVFGRLATSWSDRNIESLNPNFPSLRDVQIYNFASQWVHTFSQNMINEVRFGFQTHRNNIFTPRTNDESFSMDALGIGEFRVFADNNRPLAPDEHGVPSFNLYNINDRSFENDPDSQQVGNHLSVIKGSHNFKMGYEFYRVTFVQRGGNLSAGRLTFGNRETGNRHAAVLMGFPQRTETAEGTPRTDAPSIRQGVYFQDDWKVHAKLTLNLGFRFDYLGNPRERLGRWRTIDFPGEGRGLDNFADPETGALIPTIGPEFVDEKGYVKLWHQDVRFFMPRLGIAYRPTEKWVVRAGAGYFDNIMHGNAITILSLMPPLSGSLQFDQVTDSTGSVMVTGADGQSYNVATRRIRDASQALTLDDPFLDAGEARVKNVNTLHVKPDYKDGEVWKWSFDIQRELPWNSSLTVGYVGSKASHVANSIRNWNSPQPSPDSNLQANRPFPRFFDTAQPERGVQGLAVVRYLDSYGNGFHQGLQARLEKRYSVGLTYGVAYSYSKTHGDGEAGGNQGAQYQNPRFCRQECDRGRVRFDQTHSAVINYNWEMPGGNLPGALKHILGNWQSNGILTLRTGFPYTLTASQGDLNVSDSAIRPDITKSPELSNPTRKLWYDPSAFQRVTCDIPERQDLCHFGNLGYNTMPSDGQTSLDFGFFKNIPISETFKLQLRSEFFNALNTPYFRNPQGLSYSSTNTLVPDGSRVGEIRGTRTPMRIIQFGLKLFF